jgi:hypothetical protein
MKRTNLFLFIHKALRQLLFETATCLQQTDFRSEAEAEQALDRVRETIFLFEEHARHEDHFVLPAIMAFEPAVSDCFAQEHITDMQLGQELTASVETFFLAADLASRMEQGVALLQAYNAFLVFNLQHMAKEEQLLNELLWRYCDDAAIRNIQQEIIRSTPPWVFDIVSGWMLRANNEPDLVIWLRAISATAPQAVYNGLLQKAARVLEPARWQSLSHSLTSQAAFA